MAFDGEFYTVRLTLTLTLTLAPRKVMAFDGEFYTVRPTLTLTLTLTPRKVMAFDGEFYPVRPTLTLTLTLTPRKVVAFDGEFYTVRPTLTLTLTPRRVMAFDGEFYTVRLRRGIGRFKLRPPNVRPDASMSTVEGLAASRNMTAVGSDVGMGGGDVVREVPEHLAWRHASERAARLARDQEVGLGL
jgi:hypothetical protein